MNKMISDFRKKARIYFKTNILFSVFVITSVINAWLLRYFTVNNPFDLWPIVADFSVVLILGSFGYFIAVKHQFKYFLSLAILFSFIGVVNSIYYTNFNSFTSVSLIATTTQLVGVADAVVLDIMQPRDLIFVWQIFALIFVNKNLKNKKYFEYAAKIEVGKIRALNTMVVAIILLGFFTSALSGVDISRLGKQWNREFIVLRYGIYTYHANDIVSSVRSSLTNLFGYDEASKLFRDYFEERDTSPKVNSYTDIFEGKNLLIIHAESFQKFTMDLEINGVELTPNMNRIAREGLFFSNFYAQDAVGTSSDTEFTFNTSLMPVNSGTVFVNYFDREYIATPKLLKEKNYYSFSMHANNGTFWNRNVMHPRLGYDEFFYHTKDYELDEIIQLGLSDKSFFLQSVPIIEEIHKREQNFYGTLITLTNHTPFLDVVEKGVVDLDLTMKYTYYDEELEEEIELTAPFLDGTRMGNYLTSIHYADYALGVFIDALLETDIMENTVLIVYGDHDAKLRRADYNQLFNYDPFEDDILDDEDEDYFNFDFYQRELYKSVPLIMWTKDQQVQGEIDKIMGMYDVMPTLGNMFGFHNEYALGNDIFSIEENVVVFPSGNWITNDIYYNTQRSEGKLLDPDGFVSIEEIEFYQKYSDDLLSVSSAMIIHDLIRRSTETEDLIEIYGRWVWKN